MIKFQVSKRIIALEIVQSKSPPPLLQHDNATSVDNANDNPPSGEVNSARVSGLLEGALEKQRFPEFRLGK
jgi:hypothetical protein